MEEVIDIISNVAFPIAAFGLMYQLVTKTIKENTAVIRDLCVAVRSKL